jgi:hypothetical protein
MTADSRSSARQTAHHILCPLRAGLSQNESMKNLWVALTISSSLLAQDAFRVQVTGHGQPMILIPGLSCPGEVWSSTVAHYQDRFLSL